MRSKLRLIPLFLSVLIFALSVVAIWQRQAVYDWVRLRNYTPPQEIVALADATTMNDRTKRLFYVYHPSLEDKASFNRLCTDSEKTVVLGCYIAGKGIYIYNVTDERLAGIEEVTAAHEMLHAAYERLSGRERARVDALTAEAFAAISDQRIRDTVEQYRQKDESIVPNELHSILASEVRDLPEDLENYYSRYFNDRKAIVAFSEQYQAAFTQRQAKLKEYDSRLEQLKAEINQLQVVLEAQETELARERQNLETLRSQQRLSEYNEAVPGFNERVRKYNADASRVRTLIDTYNKLVVARNEIATEENELIKAIDSRPSTIETQ